MKKNHEITPAVERLITEALAIEAESAQNAGALGLALAVDDARVTLRVAHIWHGGPRLLPV